MTLEAAQFKSQSASELLVIVEQTLIARQASAAGQIKRGRAVSLAATVLALAIPLATWCVGFLSSKSKEVDLAVFAFSSVPLAGIFVLVTITMLRRRRAIEEQMERVDDKLFEVRKLRVIADTKSSDEVNVFREIVLTRALAGGASLLNLGKEEDEAQASLNVYGALVKIVSDSRPKK